MTDSQNPSHQTTLAALIVDYIERCPATTINVASHFGMDTPAARAELLRIERAGAIRGRGKGVWERWEIASQ